MSISPVDFLVVAKNISEQSDLNEAFIRTAVGRAYYGAFLASHQHLSEHYGIYKASSQDGKDKGIHADVIYSLEENTQLKLKSAGFKLRQARDFRVIADYKPEKEVTHDDLMDALALCESIINDKLT